MNQFEMPSTSRMSIGSDHVIPPKRRRYFYRLESESSSASGSEVESVYSHQGYETELVMDTPDTDTKSEYEDSDDDVEIEYEVRSSSENEEVPIGVESSSGAEDYLAVAGAISAVMCEASFEPSLTDGEDSDDSSTQENVVHRTDYGTCIQCKLRNDNPSFRYCKKCFQVRKKFFPPRPKGFKKKVRSPNDAVPKQTDLPDIVEENDTKVIKSENSGTGSEISEKVLEQERTDSPLLQNSLTEYKELCIMCNTESKNSIFLHGSTAHMCCCYKCAMRSWKLNKKCPACNRKANNVVKVFVI